MTVTYSKVHEAWANSPATTTPISAAALDQIEEGVQTAQETADTATTAAATATSAAAAATAAATAATAAAATATADAAAATAAATAAVARVNHTGTQSSDTLTDGTTSKSFLATERTKLAGIETAATADQTAAELLTAIKTVDGSGSGLDTDVVRGTTPGAFGLTILADGTAAAHRGTLGTGTATSSNFLRGDGSWSVPAVTAAVVSILDTANDFTATDVEGALAELQTFDETIPNIAPSTDVIPDTTTVPGDVSWSLGSEIGKLGNLTVRLASGARLAAATAATTTALPTCTYANGAAGVGAFLLASANAALLAQDFQTLVAGSWLLVKNQAAAEQNGLYEVTIIGTVSTAWKLTRVPCADEAADFAAGIIVLVGKGKANGGAAFTLQEDSAVMGTSLLLWKGQTRSDVSPGDLALGPSRNRIRYYTDFEEMPTTAITSTAQIVGTPHNVFFVGAGAQAIQFLDTASRGNCELSTGTSAAGAAAVLLGSVGSGGNTFTINNRTAYGGRFRIPTLTVTATEAFNCFMGGMSFLIGGNPTDGIYFQVRATSTDNIYAVARSGGVETAVDTGIAAAAGSYRAFAIVSDPVAQKVYYYLQNAGVWQEVSGGGISTNIPSVPLSGAVLIDKTVGTTARTIRMDIFGQDNNEARTILEMIP